MMGAFSRRSAKESRDAGVGGTGSIGWRLSQITAGVYVRWHDTEA
jgi:hypothetical protein